MRERGVLLDIDGTLVDSNYEHVRAWYRAFRDSGMVIPQAWIHRSLGMGGDKLVPHLLGCGADDPRIKALGSAHDRIFTAHFIDDIQPLPGVQEFIDHALRSGYRIALASSAGPAELDRYIALLHLEGRLAATVSKGDVSESKPAPDIFAGALERLGIARERCLAVGDSVWDVEAAAGAGVATVGLSTGGFDAAELRGAGAVAVYDDLPDLLRHWSSSPFAS